MADMRRVIMVTLDADTSDAEADKMVAELKADKRVEYIQHQEYDFEIGGVTLYQP